MKQIEDIIQKLLSMSINERKVFYTCKLAIVIN